jgi:hypothetical protein
MTTLSCPLQVASALAGDTALMNVLVDGFIATPEVDYQCRLRAVRLVRQLAELLGSLRAKRNNAVVPTATEVAAEAAAAAAVAPLIKRIAAPRYHVQATLVGRALLRETLGCLRAVVGSVPPQLWQPFWCAESGSYWLTRLLRDHESAIRADAHSLLGAAAAADAPAANAWLQATWPEAPVAALRVASDPAECAAVRAAAMRFVARALLPNTANAGAASFAEVQLMQRRDFWASLAALLRGEEDTDASASAPALMRAATGLLLAAGQMDAVTPTDALDSACAWPALQQLLRADWLHEGNSGDSDGSDGSHVHGSSFDRALADGAAAAADPAAAAGSPAEAAQVDRLATLANAAALVGVLAAAARLEANDDRGGESSGGREQAAAAAAAAATTQAKLGTLAAPLLAAVAAVAPTVARAAVDGQHLRPAAAAVQAQRVRVTEHAASAAAALLCSARPPAVEAALTQAASGVGGGAAGAYALAAALRSVLGQPAAVVPMPVQMAACRLVTAAVRSHRGATLLLGGSRDAETAAALSQALGDLYWATHNASLAGLGDGSNPSDAMRAAGERVAACAALRNVVAFSAVAKRAAVAAGLHTALLAHVQETHGWLVMSALSPQARERLERGISKSGGGQRSTVAVTTTTATTTTGAPRRAVKAAGGKPAIAASGKKVTAVVQEEEAERAAEAALAREARGAKLLELVAALSVLKHLVYSADGCSDDELQAHGEVRSAVVAAGAPEVSGGIHPAFGSGLPLRWLHPTCLRRMLAPFTCGFQACP